MAGGAFDAALSGQGADGREQEGIVVFGCQAVAFGTGDRRRVPEGVPELPHDSALLPYPFFPA